MKKKHFATILCAVFITAIISSGCFLAYSASTPNLFDDNNFVYDEHTDRIRSIRLPAQQSIEDARSSSFIYSFKKYEEHDLTYDGSWKSNGVQIDQYIDKNGGTYLFDSKTNALGSISFTYSATERMQTSPQNITKEELLNITNRFLQLYLPNAEQYALCEWIEETEDKDEYIHSAYVMHFSIPIEHDWFFSSEASAMFDSCGRLTMLTLPSTDVYSLIPQEERLSIANALPDESTFDKLVETHLIDRCGEGNFSVRKIQSKSVIKTEDGYLMSIIMDISRGKEGFRHAEQIVFEEKLNIGS